MLQIRNLSNALQKRLIRPLYAQTQATPYAAVLSSVLRNADGSIHPPVTGDTSLNGVSYAGGATFTLQGGLVPGTCMIKAAGDSVQPHNGLAAPLTFGLLANFVGGTLDDLKDNNEVGVWRGPDAVFELLYPAFAAGTLASVYASATAGAPVPLYAQPGGLLSNTVIGTNIVAYLIEYNPSRIVIDLKV